MILLTSQPVMQRKNMSCLSFPPLIQCHPLCKTIVFVEQTALKCHFLRTSKTSLTLKADSLTVCHLVRNTNSTELSLSSDSVRYIAANDNKTKVLMFFRTRGFSEAQILHISTRIPDIFGSSLESTLLPKYNFFCSKGFTKDELVSLFSRGQFLFHRSLKNHIIPTYEYLLGIIGCIVKTKAAILRGPFLMYKSRTMREIMNMLQEYGMPDSSMAALLIYSSQMFILKPAKIKNHLVRIKELGIYPKEPKFATAVKALSGMTEASWDRKVKVYGKWGWTEEDVLDAFRRCPWCMVISVEKIESVMDFFTREMGFESAYLFRRPGLLLLSLEKRMKPRAVVIQFLLSKGLIKRINAWSTMFKYSEKVFIKNYLERYEEEAPQLLKFYKEATDTPSLQ